MQQQELYFCDNCGAGNPVGVGTNCFACRAPLPWAQQQQAQAAQASQAPASFTEVPIGNGKSVLTLAEPGETQSRPDPQGQLPPGFLLAGRYKIIAQVGQGGFGVVYKASDTKRRDRLVAVKQIRVDQLSPRDLAEVTDSYNREITLHPPLRHRNLPRAYDHFTDTNNWYLVMTYIDGETLEAYLKRQPGGKLSKREAMNMGVQLTDVLHYLHTRKPPIIFRDLKPANIMRTRSGRLYLIDFGIARRYQEGKTKDTVPFGSRGYASPEQYGLSQTTPRSDIYSLGATLQTLLTGFDSERDEDTQEGHAKRQSSRLLLSQSAQELLDQMLTWEPEQRPENALIVRERLLDVRDGRLRPVKLAGTGILGGLLLAAIPYLLYLAMLPFHVSIMLSLVCPLLALTVLLTGLLLLVFKRTRWLSAGILIGIAAFTTLFFVFHFWPPPVIK